MRLLRPSRRPRQLPRLSPLHLPSGVRAGEGRGELQCLSRALCRFRWLPYDGVPPAERRAFVRLQLVAWSPFAQSGFAVAEGAGGAMVFAWDREAFAQRAAAAGLPAEPSRILPETLLRPAHDAGVVLQACTVGVEGQVWRGRELVASRWWAEPPDAGAWLNFQRSAGVAADAQIEAPPPVGSGGEQPLLDQPWAQVQTLSAMEEHARLRRHALAAALVTVLLLPTLWLLHANWRVSQEVAALETEKEQLGAQAEPVLAARKQALAAMAQLDTIAAAVAHPDALSVLAHVSAHFPSDGNRVRNLELDGSRLRLVLAVPATTPHIVYVRTLEGGGWLQDVREDTLDAAPGTVALTAVIKGERAPQTQAAAASAALASAPIAATTATAATTAAAMAAKAAAPAPSASVAAPGVTR